MWINLLMPVCSVVIAVMWYIFGRDKKTVTVITAKPPGGLDPLEMEYAQIVTISDRGIYAMILYWVSKGYLEVMSETERVGVRKVSDLPDDADEHEKYLFDRLFVHGDILWLDQFPAEVSDNKGELRDLVAERFKGPDAVVENDTMAATVAAMFILIISIFVVEVSAGTRVLLPLALGAILLCALCLLQNGALGFRSKYDRFEIAAGTVGIILSLIAHILLLRSQGIMFIIIFVICFLICVPCILFMERRVNNRLYGQILGFREFIRTAEWDKLKVLSEEDPGYGMDILPYAMLFNMGTEWTAKFEFKAILTAVEKMEENANRKNQK